MKLSVVDSSSFLGRRTEEPSDHFAQKVPAGAASPGPGSSWETHKIE